MLKITMIGIATVALVTVFVNPSTAQIVQGPESQKAAIAILQYQAVRSPIEPSQKSKAMKAKKSIKEKTRGPKGVKRDDQGVSTSPISGFDTTNKLSPGGGIDVAF